MKREAFTLMSRRDAESEEFHFTIRIITGLVMRQCQSVTSFNGSGGGKIQFKILLSVYKSFATLNVHKNSPFFVKL